jgi:diadenosine tetraphosphate (Ap4A) HIT family hydrolase
MSLEEYYPVSCPFCNISSAYPPSPTSSVPISPDPEKISPQCHLILSTPHVLAFLDILPIAPGHILLTTRDHFRKMSDLHNPPSTSPDKLNAQTHQDTAKALGEWLPIVSSALVKATGIEDWNIVQNNGERAAQVVPHLHFHLIPRYQEGRKEVASKGNVDVGMLKSWRMFGRGAREELDDDEGVELARVLRESLRQVLGEEMREGGRSRL